MLGLTIIITISSLAFDPSISAGLIIASRWTRHAKLAQTVRKKMEPDAHQEFLESLSIDAKEISEIRAWSKA